MTAQSTPCSQYPDKWFSEDPKNVEECLTACRTACPIRQECLRLALENTETGPASGIWGGELPEARKELLEAREGHVRPVETVPEEVLFRSLVGAA